MPDLSHLTDAYAASTRRRLFRPLTPAERAGHLLHLTAEVGQLRPQRALIAALRGDEMEVALVLGGALVDDTGPSRGPREPRKSASGSILVPSPRLTGRRVG